MTTSEQREAFRRALRSAREAAGLSKRGLAVLLGLTQSAVWQWEDGRTVPRPETVIRLEQALQLETASLSRLLGYVPAEATARPISSVLQAVEADPRLGDRERSLLTVVYRELVRQRVADDGSATATGHQD